MLLKSLFGKPEKKVESIQPNKKLHLPGWRSAFLSQLPDVNTVIDIGVLEGTKSLYKAFPEAYLILIEALPQYEESCKALLQGRKGEYHICAAGDADGQIQIHYSPGRPGVSSTKTHLKGKWQADSISVDTPIRRLDTMFAGKQLKENILLKIDTEGMELQILNGATEFLKRVKYVITETSIALRHENSYRMVELMSKMNDAGFDVLDILTCTRSNFTKPGANIADVLFVKR